MANVFKPKRSNTASSVPTTSDLIDGELAVNSADQKIYIRDSSSILEIGDVSPWRTSGYTGIGTTSTVGIGTRIEIIPYDTQDSGTLSFEGSAGQLFSISNNLTSGSIFSVNDVSGIPSIDVDADGTIQLAPITSTEFVGIGTTNPIAKLDVNGNVNVTGDVTATGFSTSGGTSSQFLKADGSVDSSTYLTSESDPIVAAINGIVKSDGSTIAAATAGTDYLAPTGDGSALTGVSTEAFKTIAVATQSDVVADSATDTLTLVAGSNMTITTNSSGDSITFASSGGGGSTTRTVYRYVATANQTLFPSSGSISYTVGYVDVFLNGTKLDSTEFTATNGTTVTLTTGATVSDIVELIAFSDVSLSAVSNFNELDATLFS